MKIFLAGAKDDRLEKDCIAACREDYTYKRLFSFSYKGDVEKLILHYGNELEITKKEQEG